MWKSFNEEIPEEYKLILIYRVSDRRSVCAYRTCNKICIDIDLGFFEMSKREYASLSYFTEDNGFYWSYPPIKNYIKNKDELNFMEK